LSRQVNSTLTHLAEHTQRFSHDTINRYMSGVTLRSRALSRGVLFQTVLMDSWYAGKPLMLLFDGHGKRFYCPIKSDRQVDDSGGTQPYQRVDSLQWSEAELVQGKLVQGKLVQGKLVQGKLVQGKLVQGKRVQGKWVQGKWVKPRGFPKDYKVQLFRVVVSSHRTEQVVTNDVTQGSAQGTRQVCKVRWKMEQMHREVKQLTGLEACPCRKARIQRNHIHCALLVWTRLTQLFSQLGCSAYDIKRSCCLMTSSNSPKTLLFL
jgi:hypothetical protein